MAGGEEKQQRGGSLPNFIYMIKKNKLELKRQFGREGDFPQSRAGGACLPPAPPVAGHLDILEPISKNSPV